MLLRFGLVVLVVLAALAPAGEAAAAAAPAAPPALITRSKVFVAGEGGYKAFRIPGVVAAYGPTANGSQPHACSPVLIAYAEGRKNGCGDYDGQHDIVLKRSTTNGASWGALQVVADAAKLFHCVGGNLPNTGWCQFWDPTAVYDARTREVILMASYASSVGTTAATGNNSVHLWRSTDLGATFAPPQNIDKMLNAGTYHYTLGNGHGIQLQPPSEFAGRLLLPAYGIEPTFTGPGGPWGSRVFYSDDSGRTWKQGQPFVSGSAEGEVVQLPSSGHILANLRNINGTGCNGEKVPNAGQNPGQCRISARSTDGGVSFHGTAVEPALLDPSCKAGISSWPPGAAPTALLFVNDFSLTARTNIELRISRTGGASWPTVVPISNGSAGIGTDGKPSQAVAGYTDVVGIPVGAAVVFEDGGCSISAAIVDLTNHTTPT